MMLLRAIVDERADPPVVVTVYRTSVVVTVYRTSKIDKDWSAP